jgi:hypothetical protein
MKRSDFFHLLSVLDDLTRAWEFFTVFLASKMELIAELGVGEEPISAIHLVACVIWFELYKVNYYNER